MLIANNGIRKSMKTKNSKPINGFIPIEKGE